jgi:acetyl-CoA carboxylase biotin carboxyl carrier protein
MASVEPESAIIKSPFVGYFREIDPAPKVGQNVEAGESVAVIAVLGIANEIESDVSGVIEEVFVKDGDVVEYGQPLLRIKPNE